MITESSLGRTQRQMMLDAIAAKNFRPAIIPMDRERHDHRPFRVLEPAPIGFRDLQMVGDQIELLAGHLKSGMVVNLHARKVKMVGVPKSREIRSVTIQHSNESESHS